MTPSTQAAPLYCPWIRYGFYTVRKFLTTAQGPDLQRILRHTYDSAALTPDLRRACELRAINKKS